MAEKINVLTLSVLAAAALSAEHFVTLGGAVPAANAAGVGVAASDANTGDQVPVQVSGVAIVVSGAAVTQYAAVSTDNAGAAVPQTSTNPTVGRALDAATGAGQRIRVLLIPT